MVQDIESSKTEEKDEVTDLRLVIYPDPFLRFNAEPFNDEQITTPLIRNTVKAMIKSMYKHHGVGLAAQQVGVPQRVFVMDALWHQTKRKRPKYFINPEIIEFDSTEGAIELTRPGEGCLSLPYGFRRPIPRVSRVKLKWRRLNGSERERWFTGLEAIVIQHELDHLNGQLFTDRLSRLQRDMFKRRVKKIRRQYKKGFKRGLATMKQKAAVEARMEKARQRAQDRIDKQQLRESKRLGHIAKKQCSDN